MTLGKPSERLFLYRKWPKTLLNRLSEARKHRYLFRRLPNSAVLELPFTLPQDFQGLKRLIFIWPADTLRAITCFPVVTSFKKAWPGCSELHLTSPEFSPFLQMAFGKDNVASAHFSQMRLDDTNYSLLASRMREFKGDITFSLDPSPTAWQQFILALSGSRFRCHLGPEIPYPIANLQVRGAPGEALFTLAQRITPLMQGSGLLTQGLHWARLKSSQAANNEALTLIQNKRLNPGNLWAYIPNSTMPMENDIAQSLRRQEGSIEIFTLQLKEGWGIRSAPTFGQEENPHRARIVAKDLSELLGLASWLKGAFGPPSPLLYLLSLTDLEIRTWLSAPESDLDLSGFNARFRLLPALGGSRR